MKRLPIHSQHESLHAKFGEFAGFEMPLYYTKPIEEHHAVRNGVGVFDISHMGQFILSGDKAGEMLNYVLPGDVHALRDGQALYSPLCREDGGILDDLIIYRYNNPRYRIIVNAGTRERDYLWLAGIAEEFEVSLEDISSQCCLFAVQGPRAFEKLEALMEDSPAALDYYTFIETRALDEPVFLARTGYTGEPGCEIAVAAEKAEALWRHLVKEMEIPPIGLAARDTLRLEAGMPLYSHELREEWHPLETGLAWTINLKGDEEFIGKKALVAIRGVGFPYRHVGLEMTGRGIPREDYPVLQNGAEIGRVTSGALSPTTGKGIALARLRIPFHKTGTAVQVEMRGKSVDAVVVRRPFYKNPTLRESLSSSPRSKRLKIFS